MTTRNHNAWNTRFIGYIYATAKIVSLCNRVKATAIYGGRNYTFLVLMKNHLLATYAKRKVTYITDIDKIVMRSEWSSSVFAVRMRGTDFQLVHAICTTKRNLFYFSRKSRLRCKNINIILYYTSVK